MIPVHWVVVGRFRLSGVVNEYVSPVRQKATSVTFLHEPPILS